MNSALRHKVAKRTSLPLTVQDLEDLSAISGSPAALDALDVDASMSEAALLHRVFQLGVKRAYELLDEVGYAQLATDPERAEFQRISKARRRG
ncbi:MAG: hypothetical protein CVT64_00630 [Actinobacteria bacterium HGW-Actinobacteria-4]|nr:MAG: hypothetical protein CVT64_00630 [Actinobacteria bacterium HGW-Actinobacteria-4]